MTAERVLNELRAALAQIEKLPAGEVKEALEKHVTNAGNMVFAASQVMVVDVILMDGPPPAENPYEAVMNRARSAGVNPQNN